MKIIQKSNFVALLIGVLLASEAASQARYEADYPFVPYAQGPSSNAVSELFDGLNTGESSLEFHQQRGFLDSVLEALEIDPSSQVLVFSKSSLKKRFITPETPRALYFNDEVYVGWVQGSSSLEIGAMDAELGPVFFDLPQIAPENASQQPEGEFQLNRCLRCHDSYSLTGGGVPRFMLSSVLAGEEGEIVSHEINIITDTAVPLFDRWGGWYVSGSHGQQRHLGNLIIRDRASFDEREQNLNGNLSELGALVDLSPYKRDTSDIVALLVLEHQIEVQNRMTRASWEVRNAKAQGMLEQALLVTVAEPLVRALLMLDEVSFEGPISGMSDYEEYFQALGPFDSAGNSLRTLELQSRTFEYPLSYLLYSDAFKALPEELKEYLYTRLGNVLSGREELPEFLLEGDQRSSLLKLMRETIPEIVPYL